MAFWHFIPQPVEIRGGDGEFLLGKRVAIVLPAAAGDEDLFAARQFQAAVSVFARLDLLLEKRFHPDYPGPAIILMRADRDIDWLPAGMDLSLLKPQGYLLHVTPENIFLIGADAPGLFYAVQTGIQLLDQAGQHLPSLTIVDYPVFPVRGVMLDVSRGKVPTVETVLEVVERLASWKINQFQLYIEHSFRWPSHPKISEGYDPLTANDILAIDAACALRHIDFVPNLQSFGHQGHLLQLRQYRHLAESELKWTLSPTEPGTYQLLDELYAEFLPNFRSRLLNVDSDETWDLGKGKSARKVAEQGLGRVYLDHMLRVRELAAKHGRRMMFWGDIILHDPELIPHIPDDAIVLQWDYSDKPSEEHVRKFADAGKNFYVCPSVHGFVSFFPRQRVARDNIRALADYGARYGALGLLNTDWGDAGHSNLQGLAYYGYAFGAAESWGPGRTENFDHAFGRLFFGSGGEVVMEAMHSLEQIADPVPDLLVWDFPAFHQPFLSGKDYREKLTPEIVDTIRAHAARALSLLTGIKSAVRADGVLNELIFAAIQENAFADKATLAITFHQRYAAVKASGDIAGLEMLLRDVRAPMRKLIKTSEDIADLLVPLWLLRAHESGLAEMVGYHLEVADDLRSSLEWLNNALKDAKKTGVFPDLPSPTDAWFPQFESPNGLLKRAAYARRDARRRPQ
ncbi:MAG: Beta-hexosaminidase [bacterium ADurb.Bin429]|nr:MAG: Beta-hexosaminidase [bacterium ADurb.Bin429]